MDLPSRLSSLTTKANFYKGLVRLTPFDTSSDEGRSRERYRRIALTALASAGSKGVTVLTGLISIPLTVNYLGSERYGLWMTISSFIAVLGFADLGIGNGLLNAVSEANGKDDRNLAMQYVSSGAFTLFAITLVLAIAFIGIYPHISWIKVFNVTSRQAASEAGPAMAVFVGCSLLNIPLGIVQRIQLGYQEGFYNSLWTGAGNLLGLGGILLVIFLQAGLPWLVLAMAGGPTLALLINGMILFGHARPWLQPKFNAVTRSATRKIFQLGFLFFVLQFAVAIGFQSDNMVITQILGPDQVTQYAIPKKLFAFIPMILGFALGALWPAYGEALARHDMDWVKRTIKRSIQISLAISLLFAIIFVPFGRLILRLWVGPTITPSLLLLVGLGLWILISSILNPIAMLLNGASVIKFQVITAALMTIANITLSIVLVQRIGVSGAIYGTVLSLFFCILIPMVFFLPRFLGDLQAQS